VGCFPTLLFSPSHPPLPLPSSPSLAISRHRSRAPRPHRPIKWDQLNRLSPLPSLNLRASYRAAFVCPTGSALSFNLSNRPFRIFASSPIELLETRKVSLPGRFLPRLPNCILCDLRATLERKDGRQRSRHTHLEVHTVSRRRKWSCDPVASSPFMHRHCSVIREVGEPLTDMALPQMLWR
jgi:hypothetical protein